LVRSSARVRAAPWRRIEGHGRELVDAGFCQFVEAIGDRILVADDRGVLGSGEPLPVEHRAVRRQLAVDHELLGGPGRAAATSSVTLTGCEAASRQRNH
jgi:hypothetical protein